MFFFRTKKQNQIAYKYTKFDEYPKKWYNKEVAEKKSLRKDVEK